MKLDYQPFLDWLEENDFPVAICAPDPKDENPTFAPEIWVNSYRGLEKDMSSLLRELSYAPKVENSLIEVDKWLVKGETIFSGGEFSDKIQLVATYRHKHPEERFCESLKDSFKNDSTTHMTLNDYRDQCHAANQKWWQDLETGEPITRNKGELLMLVVSEVAEAMEGERKDLMDDKLPHRKMAEVEIVDAMIRLFDYAGGFGYDLQGAFEEKMKFNASRKDHSHEARKLAGGKKF